MHKYAAALNFLAILNVHPRPRIYETAITTDCSRNCDAPTLDAVRHECDTFFDIFLGMPRFNKKFQTNKQLRRATVYYRQNAVKVEFIFVPLLVCIISHFPAPLKIKEIFSICQVLLSRNLVIFAFNTHNNILKLEGER